MYSVGKEVEVIGKRPAREAGINEGVTWKGISSYAKATADKDGMLESWNIGRRLSWEGRAPGRRSLGVEGGQGSEG